MDHNPKIKSDAALRVEFDDTAREIEISGSGEIKDRFRRLLSEVFPEDNMFRLSADIASVQKEIKRSRKDESAWPKSHYLWKLNPITQWVNDKALAHFGRHEAPIISLGKALGANEKVFLMTGLGSKPIPNTGAAIDTAALKKLLPAAVDHARGWMTRQRNEFENRINEKLNDELKELERLKECKLAHLKKRYSGNNQPSAMGIKLQEKEAREIEKLFDGYFDWVQETMTTEEHAYIRVVAALV